MATAAIRQSALPPLRPVGQRPVDLRPIDEAMPGGRMPDAVPGWD